MCLWGRTNFQIRVRKNLKFQNRLYGYDYITERRDLVIQIKQTFLICTFFLILEMYMKKISANSNTQIYLIFDENNSTNQEKMFYSLGFGADLN